MSAERDIVFYDGDCGFCHRTVAFLVTRDARHRLDFAPLQGRTFQERVDAAAREGLPDSLVVLTPEGDLLTRSRAALRLARRLGGAWRVLGTLGALVPRALADRAYAAIAARRARLASRPSGLCPALPPDLRERFLP